MLTGLRLENIALIEGLELSFSAGFTVLTGETGAGKSILLDALDALLGGAQGSAGARLLRRGAERGVIEASFSLTPPVLNWLGQQQLEPEDELLLTREWRLTEERLTSRHRLNGVAVSRAQIQELRPLLLDLTVQGQTQQLGRPGQQRRWLDRFGGDPVQALLEPVVTAWSQWKRAAAELDQARADLDQIEQQRALQEQTLADLEAAQLEDPHERQQLLAEENRLAHGVRLQEGVMALLGRLVEGAEQAPSVLDHLAVCEQELLQMEGLDGGVAPLRNLCSDSLSGLQELARNLDGYGAALESDPESLGALQERMAQLKAGGPDRLARSPAGAASSGGRCGFPGGPGIGRAWGPPAKGSGQCCPQRGPPSGRRGARAAADGGPAADGLGQCALCGGYQSGAGG